jgi:hypothetical protein
MFLRGIVLGCGIDVCHAVSMTACANAVNG